MNLTAVFLIIFSQICLVAGQIWLKHAMNQTHHETMKRSTFILNFALGIGAMTLWFLLWLG